MRIHGAGTPFERALLRARTTRSLNCINGDTSSLLEKKACIQENQTMIQPMAKSFSVQSSFLNRVKEDVIKTHFDLIIIGGGINGCGIACDAALRRLKVLLLEKEDFGAGCTSASTRLVHGGLRYLEHFEFDLVRESLRERESLLKNAKHLVRPLELCIPIYRGDKRGYWLIKAGMFLYDLLSFDKKLPRHKMMSADDFVAYEDGVKKENLIGAAIYYDAQVAFPERICLENTLMADKYGALVLNHAKVIGINVDSNKISNIEFVDCLTNKKFNVKGKVIVNVSGPWVDSLCGLTNRSIERKIGGTKGSHIIIKTFEEGPKHAIYASSKSDGRPFFIIPWQNYYLIGTTDIPYFGDLDKLQASNEEIKYLLDESNKILSSKKIKAEDVLFSCTGIRPLPYTSGKDPSEITRRHIIFDHESNGINNFISIIGGKLTTYRNLSEQAVNLICKKLKYNFIKSSTKNASLIGNIDRGASIEVYKKNQIKKSQKKYDLDQEIISHLIDYYGKRYKDVLDLVLEDPELGKLLSSHTLDIRAQIDFAIRKEFACTITDLLLRRTTLGLNEGLGEDAISQVSKQLQTLLNYSSQEIEKQIKDYENNIVKLRKM